MDSVSPCDVGVVSGELFGLKYPYFTGPLGLAYSSDFGHTFSVSLINFPGAPIFQYCQVHRGTQAGELFFFVLKTFDTIYIYHSFDYGQNLTLRNIIPYSIEASDETYCTAGRAPGSVYIVRRGVCDLMFSPHTCLWIDFSRDFGVTFTRYFHDIDSVYTNIPLKPETSGFKIFPNPAHNILTLELAGFHEQLQLTQRCTGSVGSTKKNMTIELYTVLGEKKLQKEINPDQDQTSLNVSMFPRGVYFLRLTSNKQQIITEKLLLD